MRTRNVSEYMLVLAVCLVAILWKKHASHFILSHTTHGCRQLPLQTNKRLTAVIQVEMLYVALCYYIGLIIKLLCINSS